MLFEKEKRSIWLLTNKALEKLIREMKKLKIA